MIAEAGLAALWLAAGLAALQFVLMVLSLRIQFDGARSMRSIAVVQGLLTLVAFAMLLIVFALVKFMNSLRRSEHDAAPAEPPPPPEDVLLLREIRDSLKQR